VLIYVFDNVLLVKNIWTKKSPKSMSFMTYL